MFVNTVTVLEISTKYGMSRSIVSVNNRCELEVGGDFHSEGVAAVPPA